MVEPGVYLEKLSAFSRMLRLEGLSVSPKETADASQILITLGVENREQMRIALRTVFAKSREEQAAFDRVFDGFFISEDAMRRQAQQQMEMERQQALQQQQAQKDLESFGQSISLTEEQYNTYASMPQESKDRLKNFMDKYKASAERNPNLYGNFIHSVFARALLDIAENLATGLYIGSGHRTRRLLLLSRAGADPVKLAQALPDLDAVLLLKLRSQPAKRQLALLAGIENRDLPQYSLLLGKAHFALKDYAAAVPPLQQAEASFPREVRPLLETCFRELGDFRQAYEYACKQR